MNDILVEHDGDVIVVDGDLRHVGDAVAHATVGAQVADVVAGERDRAGPNGCAACGAAAMARASLPGNHWA